MKIKIDGKIREFRTVWMEKDGTVKMIDQRKLPHTFEIFESKSYLDTAWAIKEMVVRGAGAIGATAAFAVAQAALSINLNGFDEFIAKLEEAANVVRSTRPTAVNLFHAIDRVLFAARKCNNVEDAKVRVFEEAQRIADEDVEACRKIGEYGSEFIEDGDVVLTHCNAGALAFVDFGTALAPIRIAHYSGKKVVVFVDETRPRLQGARLTAWELKMEGIEHYVIADNAAGYFMKKGVIKKVIVGADRIAANGDVANKIGTYKLALAAKANGVPFYVAAPTSTFDLNCPSGDKIPIEERGEDEVIYVWGVTDRGERVKVRIVPEDCKARNPAFDVTPNELISAIITEKGVLYPPFSDSIRKML